MSEGPPTKREVAAMAFVAAFLGAAGAELGRRFGAWVADRLWPAPPPTTTSPTTKEPS